jgi:serine O-acetyltransferase
MSEPAGRTIASTLQFDPGQKEFEAYLGTQLGLVSCQIRDLSTELSVVYPRIERQFGRIRNKYFRNDKGPLLRVAHNAQYTIFLYQLARCTFENGNRSIADRIYSLLRIVSSIDLYYEVKLPELWACDHPLGSVIGRGQFTPDATLFFTQNCNIGNNRGIYPQIEGNLHMYANASLLGDTRIRGNVVLSNGAYALDAGELRDCLVFGRSPDLVIKPLAREQFVKLSPLVLN